MPHVPLPSPWHRWRDASSHCISVASACPIRPAIAPTRTFGAALRGPADTCTGALPLYPDLSRRLADADRPHAAGLVAETLGRALPPIRAGVLAMWSINLAAVLFKRGCLLVSLTPRRGGRFLLLISADQFNGPGGRRAVGGALLTSGVAAVDSSLARFLEGCHSVFLSIDTMTDASGGGVYNVVIHTPWPFLVATFGMGSDSSTAANRLARLHGALQAPLLPRFATSSTTELAAGVAVLSPFGHRRILALLMHSPTTMVVLRGIAVASGSILFAVGCGAHAANLVAQDAAREPI